MRPILLIIIFTALFVSPARGAETSSGGSVSLPGRPAPAFGAPRILPVDQAFQVSALDSGDAIEVRWLMPEGYYLYRHAFELRADGGEAHPFSIPDGEPKVDEFFGDVEVYFREIVMEVPNDTTEELTLRYQGCAEAGYCYPPQKVTLSSLLPD